MIVTGPLAYWILRSLWWERQCYTTARPLTPHSTSGDFCAIIQSECYIFIPNKSFNVTHLMNHMKNQISALNDPFPSFDEHHRFDGHEFGWTPEVSDGQGGLACCDSWGRKELDTTEWLNWTELNWIHTVGEMATHSSILAWRIPWTEEPIKLQSMGS